MDQLFRVLFGTEFPPLDAGDHSNSRHIFVSGPPGDYRYPPSTSGPPKKPNLRDEILMESSATAGGRSGVRGDAAFDPRSCPMPSSSADANRTDDPDDFRSELGSLLAMQESVFRSFFEGASLSIPMMDGQQGSQQSSSSSFSSGSRRSFRMHPDGSTESTETIQHPDGSKETTVTHCDAQKICETMRTLEHADGRVEVMETSEEKPSRESILL